MPALQSFCIYAAIGILSVFLYTITFFVACLAIDAKRQEQRRDSVLFCVKLDKDWEPMPCSKRKYLQLFIKEYYAPALLSVPGKVSKRLTTTILDIQSVDVLQFQLDFIPQAKLEEAFIVDKPMYLSIDFSYRF